MKGPKIKVQAPPEQEKITPLPDLGGAATSQARYDALKQLLSRRGRSSTILTWGSKRALRNGSHALSGRLSDVEGARSVTRVARG